MNRLELKNYYIAYIDILGYKEHMKKYCGREHEFLEMIDITFRFVHMLTDTSKVTGNHGTYNFFNRVYSDNIVVCIESREYGCLFYLCQLVVLLQQFLMAKYKILVRGAITEGQLHISENYIFGSGLIKAYELENRVAIYPRIIVESKIMQDESISAFCVIDSDGYKYLHYLEGFGDKTNTTTAFSEHKKNAYSVHKEMIVDNLNEYKDKDKENIIQKYQWCKGYHNNSCKLCGYTDLII